MSITAYTPESYAPHSQQQLYQDDARIFHRTGYRYAAVALVEQGQPDPHGVSFALRLSDGAPAWLRLQVEGPDLLRLLFAREPFETPSSSPMLLPRLAEPPPWCYEPTPETDRLIFGTRTVEIGRAPFNLQIWEQPERLIFELETEEVAGAFVCAPLGLRTGPNGAEPFLSWRIHNGEQFFGLGEKFAKVERSSTRATIWSSDTLGTNTTDLAYKSVPVLHSTAGWGLLLHSSYRSLWEIGTFSYTAGSLLSEDPRLDALLWFAPTLKQSVGVYTALTGRLELPPLWAFGIWMSRCAYQTSVEVDRVLARLRAEQIPCDVVHLDPCWMETHYYPTLGVDACDFVWRAPSWPDPQTMLGRWRDQGFATSFWINPYLPEGTPIYAEAAEHGYLLRSTAGGVARLAFGETVGMVDFTNPAAKEWWKGYLKRLVAQGAAVFKPDYGDRIPENALAANGQTGRSLHNLYLHLYAEAAMEAVRETLGYTLVWRRAGYLGTQRYPGTWAGDTQVSWEAMRCCLHGGLSAGFTGEACWSHDIGGFVGPRPSPELYIRWAQWGLLSPFARFHGTTPREPWEYGAEALEVVRHYAHLRYTLIPYLWACAEESAASGLPIMRHMKLEFPDEPGVEHVDDQYMLGPDLLVAPVFQAGARERAVYVPPGRWTSWDAPEQVYEGPGYRHVPAPLARLPLLVRQRARIPRFREAPQHLKGALPEIVLEER